MQFILLFIAVILIHILNLFMLTYVIIIVYNILDYLKDRNDKTKQKQCSTSEITVCCYMFITTSYMFSRLRSFEVVKLLLYYRSNILLYCTDCGFLNVHRSLIMVPNKKRELFYNKLSLKNR